MRHHDRPEVEGVILVVSPGDVKVTVTSAVPRDLVQFLVSEKHVSAPYVDGYGKQVEGIRSGAHLVDRDQRVGRAVARKSQTRVIEVASIIVRNRRVADGLDVTRPGHVVRVGK